MVRTRVLRKAGIGGLQARAIKEKEWVDNLPILPI